MASKSYLASSAFIDGCELTFTGRYYANLGAEVGTCYLAKRGNATVRKMPLNTNIFEFAGPAGVS